MCFRFRISYEYMENFLIQILCNYTNKLIFDKIIVERKRKRNSFSE